MNKLAFLEGYMRKEAGGLQVKGKPSSDSERNDISNDANDLLSPGNKKAAVPEPVMDPKAVAEMERNDARKKAVAKKPAWTPPKGHPEWDVTGPGGALKTQD